MIEVLIEVRRRMIIDGVKLLFKKKRMLPKIFFNMGANEKKKFF